MRARAIAAGLLTTAALTTLALQPSHASTVPEAAPASRTTAAVAAPQSVKFACFAPEGRYRHCRDVLVPAGRKLVVYNRTSQNETIGFLVHKGVTDLALRHLRERDEAAVWKNNGGNTVKVSLSVASHDNDVHTGGTISTPQ
ncbi:hypothetical protein [Streptomyces sp. G45]|uniref:hypothetical protein n=1 Tax=Streptomyces sp. G45 TaxID=3406627 RepID=UPI003C1D8907